MSLAMEDVQPFAYIDCTAVIKKEQFYEEETDSVPSSPKNDQSLASKNEDAIIRKTEEPSVVSESDLFTDSCDQSSNIVVSAIENVNIPRPPAQSPLKQDEVCIHCGCVDIIQLNAQVYRCQNCALFLKDPKKQHPICQICGEQFESKSQLFLHMRIHTIQNSYRTIIPSNSENLYYKQRPNILKQSINKVYMQISQPSTTVKHPFSSEQNIHKYKPNILQTNRYKNQPSYTVNQNLLNVAVVQPNRSQSCYRPALGPKSNEVFLQKSPGDNNNLHTNMGNLSKTNREIINDRNNITLSSLLGKGNYGISSKMNSYASRLPQSKAPSGPVGHITSDSKRLKLDNGANKAANISCNRKIYGNLTTNQVEPKPAEDKRYTDMVTSNERFKQQMANSADTQNLTACQSFRTFDCMSGSKVYDARDSLNPFENEGVSSQNIRLSQPQVKPFNETNQMGLKTYNDINYSEKLNCSTNTVRNVMHILKNKLSRKTSPTVPRQHSISDCSSNLNNNDVYKEVNQSKPGRDPAEFVGIDATISQQKNKKPSKDKFVLNVIAAKSHEAIRDNFISNQPDFDSGNEVNNTLLTNNSRSESDEPWKTNKNTQNIKSNKPCSKSSQQLIKLSSSLQYQRKMQVKMFGEMKNDVTYQQSRDGLGSNSFPSQPEVITIDESDDDHNQQISDETNVIGNHEIKKIYLNAQSQSTYKSTIELPKCDQGMQTCHMKLLPVPNFSSKTAQFDCETCGEKFRSRKRMNSHMELHKNNSDYECSVCSATFVEMSDLVRHELVCYREYQT